MSSTGRHFTAGMDLSVFSDDSGLLGGGSDGPTEMGRQRARLKLTVRKLQDSFTALERARMPVLAAVQGGCIGGGVDMVTAADCRYATADAFFCIQEINIGMTADVGTLQRLPKLIPEGVVREYAYTGRRMPAARAHELGLVNEVFDYPRRPAGRCPPDRRRDRRQQPAGRLGLEGVDQLQPRPLGGRQPRAHRHLADGHVPAPRHAGDASAPRPTSAIPSSRTCPRPLSTDRRHQAVWTIGASSPDLW